MKKILASACVAALTNNAIAQTWDGYAGNPQHTALSNIASQPLGTIHWQTPVDLNPQYSYGSSLLIHYGSPIITPSNTVIVPVKTGASGGFELNAFNGFTGAALWNQSTDYSLPPKGQGASYSWTPPYAPTHATNNTLYYAGDGGTIYTMSNLDSATPSAPTQEAFYGSSTYAANQGAYNAGVAISTPITADSQGNIYFGYQTSDSAPPPDGLTNGIARISADGLGTFFEASKLMAGGSSAGMTQVATNCAPAISNDGSTVYVAMSTGNFSAGRLVALNSTTLSPTASVPLLDPKTGGNALLPNDGTASPMVGPDGDVYMGVLDDYGTSRGWMEHFNSSLTLAKPTGGFGWDDTPSVVPARMVPSYQGTSSYLIMTKYNNYADRGTGGNGQNMIAVLDPNATQIDTRYNSNGAGGATIMKQILTILGPTPDPDFPGGVDEWCINSAAVDPDTDSVIVNNEDGHLYRWNLGTNQLTQTVSITNGLGEAYTPTAIGPDGSSYAINDATLFNVGAPTVGLLNAVWTGPGSGSWQSTANWNVPTTSAQGVSVTLATAITANTTITLDAPRTVGILTFESGFSYTIAPGSGGSLTLDNGGSPAEIDDLVGTMTITAPVQLNSNTVLAVRQSTDLLTISGNITGSAGIALGPTSTSPSAGTVELLGSNNYGGGTTVTSGTLFIGAQGALPIGAVTITGGLLQLAPNTGLAQFTSLNIIAPGALDLTNNHLILAYTGASPVAAVASALKTGYANGTWTGAGITSSAAAANTYYGLGYADGADGVVPGLFSGQIEIEYTLYGDLNLDGAVNGSDFAIFAAHFGQTVTGGWDEGDLNHDGSVNGTDFALLAQNFGKSATGAAIALPESDWTALDSFAAAHGLLADVPEPACALTLLTLAGFSLTSRRRRAGFNRRRV